MVEVAAVTVVDEAIEVAGTKLAGTWCSPRRMVGAGGAECTERLRAFGGLHARNDKFINVKGSYVKEPKPL